MPQLWSLLNHSQTEGWFSGRAKKMWIHQAHWHIAHTTNTHTSWLNTSDTGERWARAEANDQEVEQPHKLQSLLILQLTAELEDVYCVVVSNMWMWPFLCVCRLQRSWSQGLQPPLLLWTMHHKNLHTTWWFPTPVWAWASGTKGL